jgi:hypothetical protein
VTVGVDDRHRDLQKGGLLCLQAGAGKRQQHGESDATHAISV